jgi:uncharacterized protein YbbC (DUF1343 family)
MKVMVRNGLDQPEEMDRYLRGQRVGLVTAGSAVTRDLQQAVDVISGR